MDLLQSELQPPLTDVPNPVHSLQAPPTARDEANISVFIQIERLFEKKNFAQLYVGTIELSELVISIKVKFMLGELNGPIFGFAVVGVGRCASGKHFAIFARNCSGMSQLTCE